jgi:hypothetical protein
MTLDDFRHLAGVWGGDIARWPEHRRDAARDLERSSAAAAGILREARALDRLIGGARPVVGEERAERVIHAVVTRLAAQGGRAAERSWRLVVRWLAPAVSFASAAVLGVYLGLSHEIVPAGGGAEALVSLIFDGAPVQQAWF